MISRRLFCRATKAPFSCHAGRSFRQYSLSHRSIARNSLRSCFTGLIVCSPKSFCTPFPLQLWARNGLSAFSAWVPRWEWVPSRSTSQRDMSRGCGRRFQPVSEQAFCCSPLRGCSPRDRRGRRADDGHASRGARKRPTKPDCRRRQGLPITVLLETGQ